MPRFLIFIFLILNLFCLTSCSKKKIYGPKDTYSVATQQTPYEDVYYPVKWVRSPNPPLENKAVLKSNKLIIPIYSYDFKNASLCEIGLGLAASLKYELFCSSKLTRRKANINFIGNPFEMKDFLEKQTNIKIIIDAPNKHISFLEKEVIVPEYSD